MYLYAKFVVTMYKRIILSLWTVIGILFAVGCSDYEPMDEFESGKVSDFIKSDFYQRYSKDVDVTEAFTYYDNSTRISFIDSDGLPCTAIYQGFEWVFTQKNYEKDDFAFLNQLPQNVARAYIRAGIDNEDYQIDDAYVIEVSRNGFDNKFYEFEFTAPYSNNEITIEHFYFHLLIDEKGELIDVLNSNVNPSIWWYNMNDCVSYVNHRYPEAELLAAYNDAGDNVLYINDKGIQKKVRFRQSNKDQIWSETSYRLDNDIELPESVRIGYEKYRTEHPDFIYDEVYHIERKDGIFYGLTMNVMSHNVFEETVYFKI